MTHILWPLYLITGSLALLAVGCESEADDLKGGKLIFQDDFSKPSLAEHWRVGRVDGPPSKGGGPRSQDARRGYWAVSEGTLHTPGERNQPLWLTRPLPEQVRVEFSARTEAEAGDIKFEIFGDGHTHESGYILILGGWNNSRSIVARQDEHQRDRVERNDSADRGRSYNMALVRRNDELRWYVDGRLYLRYADPAPLRGDPHRFFAFNSWRSELHFNKLRIFDLAKP